MSRPRPPEEFLESTPVAEWIKIHDRAVDAPIEHLVSEEDRVDVEASLMAAGCRDLNKGVREIWAAAKCATTLEERPAMNSKERALVCQALSESAAQTRRFLEAESDGYELQIQRFCENPDEEYLEFQRLPEVLQRLEEASARATDYFHSLPAKPGPRGAAYGVVADYIWFLDDMGLIQSDCPLSRRGPYAELFEHACRLAGLNCPTTAVHHLSKAREARKESVLTSDPPTD